MMPHKISRGSERPCAVAAGLSFREPRADCLELGGAKELFKATFAAISIDGANERRETQFENTIEKKKVRMVGVTGIEPVTPTMST